jgi:hypothetical protein
MYPHERSLVKRLEGKPFALIGINSDEDRAKLKNVLTKENVTWRSFWDRSISGPIDRAWNVQSWPTIYVIDARGVIRYQHAQDDDRPIDSELDEAIDTLLLEAQGKPAGHSAKEPVRK